MNVLATQTKDNVSIYANIDSIEKELLNFEQQSCPVTHRFGTNLYIRELFMPAGTFAIGHEQRFDHFNVMLKGKVIVLNSDGTTTELVAPLSFQGKAGRKIGYVVEDMIWQNIYSTNETDIGILEDTYLNKSDNFKLRNTELNAIKFAQREIDRLDFQDAIRELGFTEDMVLEQSINEIDQISIKLDDLKVKVGKSQIDNTGIIATANFNKNESIGIARFNGFRTQLGRYINHSKYPNASMVKVDSGDIFVISNRDIKGCCGGEDGEEITIDYRLAFTENIRIKGV